MQSLEILCPSQPMDYGATVLASDWLTPTIKSVRLRLDQPTFRFLPGQSVWAKLERDGRAFTKIYSIASSPSLCPEVELCISRVGWGSAYVQDLLVGETLRVRSPYGLMTIDRLPTRPRLYIAEGSGIAPLKSQIDWLSESNFPHPIYLIQANPETIDCLPYQEHWRSLERTWSQFHYIEAIDITPEKALLDLPFDLDAFDIDICAVNDRPSELQDHVLMMGGKLDRTRSEKFYAF